MSKSSNSDSEYTWEEYEEEEEVQVEEEYEYEGEEYEGEEYEGEEYEYEDEDEDELGSSEESQSVAGELADLVLHGYENNPGLLGKLDKHFTPEGKRRVLKSLAQIDDYLVHGESSKSSESAEEEVNVKETAAKLYTIHTQGDQKKFFKEDKNKKCKDLLRDLVDWRLGGTKSIQVLKELAEKDNEENNKVSNRLKISNNVPGSLASSSSLRQNTNSLSSHGKKILELVNDANSSELDGNDIKDAFEKEINEELKLWPLKNKVVNGFIQRCLRDIKDIIVGNTTGKEKIERLRLAAKVCEGIEQYDGQGKIDLDVKFPSREQKDKVNGIITSLFKCVKGGKLNEHDYPNGVNKKNFPSCEYRKEYTNLFLGQAKSLAGRYKGRWEQEADQIGLDLVKEEQKRKQQQQQQQQQFEKMQREIEKQYHEQELLKGTKETHKEKMWNYAKNDTAALGKDFAIGFGVGVLAFAAIAMTGGFAAPLLLLPLVFGGLNVARKYEQQERHKAQAKLDDRDIRKAEKKQFDLSEQHLDLEKKSEVNFGVKMDRHIRSHADHVRGNNKGMNR